MLERDALSSKISIIKNCLRSIGKARELKPGQMEEYLIDDIVVVNLERAIQASIDSAHIIIADRGLPLPATYKDSFFILARENILPDQLAKNMVKLVGFRNIAVHAYQKIRREIVYSILEHRLRDFEDFCAVIHSFRLTAEK